MVTNEGPQFPPVVDAFRSPKIPLHTIQTDHSNSAYRSTNNRMDEVVIDDEPQNQQVLGKGFGGNRLPMMAG